MSHVAVGGVGVRNLRWLWRGSREPCAARGTLLLEQASGIVRVSGVGVEVVAVAVLGKVSLHSAGGTIGGTRRGFTPFNWRYRSLVPFLRAQGARVAVGCVLGVVGAELRTGVANP